MTLDALVQDVRFGLRTLHRNPVFAGTAVLTLALATGASTLIFSVLSSILLRPLPFAEPGRLVQLEGTHPLFGATSIAWADLEGLREGATSLEALAAYHQTTLHVADPSGPERVAAIMADDGLFDLLGVPALRGRAFRAGDAPDGVVISEALWTRRFGRDPSAVGQPVVLDGRPYTLLGVMPESFQFPYRAASLMAGALPESRTDVWVMYPTPTAARAGRAGSVVGRLRSCVEVTAAAAELDLIVRRTQERSPESNAGVGIRTESLTDAVVGPVRTALWLLFAAVGLVLVAACTNVAGLLLTRMAARAPEVATRGALGASRPRLARQLFVEGLILAAAGGLGGVFLAVVGLDLASGALADKLPRAHEIVVDWRAFAFLLAVCSGAALLFGTAPALVALRRDAGSPGARLTMGRAHGRLRDSLVISEVALAFLLGVGATVVVREAVRLRRVDPGMATDHVLTLHLTPNAPWQDYYEMERRVSALPGVDAAGFIQLVPLQNWGWDASFSIEGRVEPGTQPSAGLRYVTPGYFRALEIPVARGRALTEADREDAPRVILVNEALARRYFTGEAAVGARTDRGTIVGVVGDVRDVSLASEAVPEVYYPAAQNVTMASDIGMSMLVRSQGDPTALADAVQAIVHDVNPRLAVFNVRTMERVIADSLWELMLYRTLIGAFALLAVVLAALGLYGVTAYQVASRAKELAVRLALGADGSGVARLVFGRCIALAAVGVGLGAAATLALGPLAGRLPVSDGPDAWAIAVTIALLFAVTLAAGAVPAFRAGRLEPADALRGE